MSSDDHRRIGNGQANGAKGGNLRLVGKFNCDCWTRRREIWGEINGPKEKVGCASVSKSVNDFLL